MTGPAVAVGSRWRSRDPREGGRTVEVVEVERTGRYAVVRPAPVSGAPGPATGRRTRILIAGLRGRWDHLTTPEETPVAETTAPTPTLHPATAAILRHFRHEHLPEGLMRDTSAACARLAHQMAATLPQDPEVTAGLRDLLKAKDAFVRAALPPDPTDTP